MSKGRNIEPGELIIIKKEYFKPEYQELYHRVYEAVGGFGLSYHGIGNAVFCKELFVDETYRYEKYMISWEEMENLYE